MPKPIQKSIQDYLTKIKKPTTSKINISAKQLSSSTSWILRGCKHPRTPSLGVDHKQTNGHDAATLEDVDRFLFENFRSLYLKDDIEDQEDHHNKKDDDDEEEKTLGGLMFDSPRFVDPPPDLCGSHRFYVGTGSSSSLIEEARSSITASEEMGSSPTTTTTTTSANVDGSSRRLTSDEAKEVVINPDDFITVLTYSLSPYDDFSHSMQKMIEARLDHNGKIDWEFMEELLFCYLNLNDKKSYRYILSAYVDLVVVLRENSGRLPARSQLVRAAGTR